MQGLPCLQMLCITQLVGNRLLTNKQTKNPTEKKKEAFGGIVSTVDQRASSFL